MMSAYWSETRWNQCWAWTPLITSQKSTFFQFSPVLVPDWWYILKLQHDTYTTSRFVISFQKIHSSKCDICLNIRHLYGLGRISSRAIFVLCAVLFCLALTSLSVYELLHTESETGHILPHPEQTVEKCSVKKPGFTVYGRNVSVYWLKFKIVDSYLLPYSCLSEH
jgi:hypothetical protein